MPQIAFWFDFASTYSYLTATRIETLASATGVEITWRPFLLGPIFKAQGWSTSPFSVYPAKGRYMIRDITRIAAGRGLVFHMPPHFPANGLTAARLALVADDRGLMAPFARTVFEMQFAGQADIADPEVLRECLRRINADTDTFFAAAATPEIKQRLRDQTDSAAAAGIFGAPTFVTADGELFWGDDRLEQALAWATKK